MKIEISCRGREPQILHIDPDEVNAFIPLGSQQGAFNRWKTAIMVGKNKVNIVTCQETLGFLGLGGWGNATLSRRPIPPGYPTPVCVNTATGETYFVTVTY